MKTKTGILGILITILSLGILFTQPVLSQNTLQFTSVNATSEGAIQLHWASQSNHVYQIQYADSLIDTNTGSTTWNKLYDDYPSQGTNTFWLDTGSFNVIPYIPHPKNTSMRFYRILDEGVDGLTNDEPTVSIVSPTNGTVATGDLTITVAADTDQAVLITKLFVDGQEQNPSPDGTNYTINTCEWGNGPHIIFAVAECLSTSASTIDSSAPLIGHTVSSFVNVTFSNLVTEISFSQPYFDPSLGETQVVSAVLAANSDWTLTIQDDNSNTVKTVTGSGNNLLFAWDGTGDGGTNVPAGTYYYYVSAVTNGLANEIENGSDSLSSPDLASETSQLWAVDTNNSETVVPLAIYPPGFDTNGLTIFEATQSEINSLTTVSLSSTSRSLVSGEDTFSPDTSGAPASQNTPASPTRPGATTSVGTVGTFGIGYQTYQANGAAGFTPTLPVSYNYGGGLEGFVSIEDMGTAKPPTWHALPFSSREALNFATTLNAGGWRPAVLLAEDQVTLSALKSSGSGNPFNNVDFGMLYVHGGYGTTADMSTGQSFEQMYFPITSGTSATYLRMSDMTLGGPSPGVGLKWMVLDACFSLYPANWSSMTSQGVKPYNNNLHLLLGGATDIGVAPQIGTFFAQDLLGNKSANKPPMTIQAAWYDAGGRGMVANVSNSSGDYPNPTKYVVAGDNNCFGDYLQTATNTVLSGTWSEEPPVQVYPPQ